MISRQIGTRECGTFSPGGLQEKCSACSPISCIIHRNRRGKKITRRNLVGPFSCCIVSDGWKKIRRATLSVLVLLVARVAEKSKFFSRHIKIKVHGARARRSRRGIVFVKRRISEIFWICVDCKNAVFFIALCLLN